MRAVLWDMDGTLVDSEKLWDTAMQAFYARHGGRLSAAVREATVGSSAQRAMRIVHTDLGLGLDAAALDASAHWLHDRVGALFADGFPWCPGARELLDALAAAEVPMALVTNTARALTERALDSIGRDYFAVTVCGDEVPRAKPAPDPYLAAATALGAAPADCLAVEDSVTGTDSARAAGCPVLVIPNAVAVPDGPGRRHATSLTGFDVAALTAVHRVLRTGETDVTSPDAP
ncbi:HAD family phosphatase [Mycolicibacillus trivialis]